MKVEPVQVGDHTVRNLLHERDAPVGIAVLLPGAYYCSQAPALYYAREAIYRAGFDVLAIDYAYFLAGRPFDADSRREAAAEARAAVEHAARIARGSRLIVAGKSLGSVLALEACLRLRIGNPTELVLLTPVDEQLGRMATTQLAAAEAFSASGAEGEVAPENGRGPAGAPPWRGFAVRCGADDLRDEDGWQQLLTLLPRTECVEVPLATHGMDSLEGYATSLQQMARWVGALEAWVRKGA